MTDAGVLWTLAGTNWDSFNTARTMRSAPCALVPLDAWPFFAGFPLAGAVALSACCSANFRPAAVRRDGAGVTDVSNCVLSSKGHIAQKKSTFARKRFA
jgi:hypothetical protein